MVCTGDAPDENERGDNNDAGSNGGSHDDVKANDVKATLESQPSFNTHLARLMAVPPPQLGSAREAEGKGGFFVMNFR